MDPRSFTNTADMQPTFGTDNSNFVAWSPSNEFFGHDFNTATPLSPNEFLKFCNALSSEVEWPDAKEEHASEKDSKRPGSEDNAAGGESDAHAMEQVKGELSRLRKELASLRQEMDDMRAWLEEVSKWSDSTNDMLAAQGFYQLSPRVTCQEPGCTCQYEGDIADVEQTRDGDAQ